MGTDLAALRCTDKSAAAIGRLAHARMAYTHIYAHKHTGVLNDKLNLFGAGDCPPESPYIRGMTQPTLVVPWGACIGKQRQVMRKGEEERALINCSEKQSSAPSPQWSLG